VQYESVGSVYELITYTTVYLETVPVKDDRKKLKSVADVTFVYAAKLQCATRQSQRLQLHLEAKSSTRATKSRDKMQVCVCVFQSINHAFLEWS